MTDKYIIILNQMPDTMKGNCEVFLGALKREHTLCLRAVGYSATAKVPLFFF